MGIGNFRSLAQTFPVTSHVIQITCQQDDGTTTMWADTPRIEPGTFRAKKRKLLQPELKFWSLGL